MTAKEALENIINEHNHLLEKYKINGGLGNWYLTVKKALTELEELKHYPTADEVCEAIQKELDYGTVEYVEGNHEFVFLNHGEQSNITDVYGDRYKITGFCKSSTITLIGRFYEGVEKVGKEE